MKVATLFVYHQVYSLELTVPVCQCPSMFTIDRGSVGKIHTQDHCGGDYLGQTCACTSCVNVQVQMPIFSQLKRMWSEILKTLFYPKVRA